MSIYCTLISVLSVFRSDKGNNSICVYEGFGDGGISGWMTPTKDCIKEFEILMDRWLRTRSRKIHAWENNFFFNRRTKFGSDFFSIISALCVALFRSVSDPVVTVAVIRVWLSIVTIVWSVTAAACRSAFLPTPTSPLPLSPPFHPSLPQSLERIQGGYRVSWRPPPIGSGWGSKTPLPLKNKKCNY